jgi:Na+-transporting NADH:ubiquinone oxidoreductase subunit B
MSAFLGTVPGSIGETSTLADPDRRCGAAGDEDRLVAHRARCLPRHGGDELLLNAYRLGHNPMFAVPWHWHLVMGGFAFGMMFMATDPVSASMTNTGKWIFGALSA